METTVPPALRRPAGRPNKKRGLERDEVPTIGKVSKKGVQMTCSKCGKISHNIRTCKWEIGGNKFIKETLRSKTAFKAAPRSKTTFKAKVTTKKQAKLNPPTISKPTFYKAKPNSSKPTFYMAKPTSFSYESKMDDVYIKKLYL
ncbi:hypothetical protein V6N13_065648 [Hibiscus sabdariffa]